MIIKYYLDNKEFAFRTREHVPRKNDVVRLNNICYLVQLVVWIEDQSSDHVAISIEKESKALEMKEALKQISGFHIESHEDAHEMKNIAIEALIHN
jgi:hypothetical protein